MMRRTLLGLGAALGLVILALMVWGVTRATLDFARQGDWASLAKLWAVILAQPAIAALGRRP